MSDTHRPTLDDVKAVIGEDVLLDLQRRSFHDQFNGYVAAETLLPIVVKVWEHIEQEHEV